MRIMADIGGRVSRGIGADGRTGEPPKTHAKRGMLYLGLGTIVVSGMQGYSEAPTA